MHVDAADFLTGVKHVDWYETRLEDAAARVHEEFCRAVVESNDDHPVAKLAYKDLREDERDMNRLFIRDIARHVAKAGYSVVRTGGQRPEVRFGSAEITDLAKAVHTDYVATRRAAGWQSGPNVDRDKRIESQLVSWGATSRARREQVRHLVRSIPAILMTADCVPVTQR